MEWRQTCPQSPREQLEGDDKSALSALPRLVIGEPWTLEEIEVEHKVLLDARETGFQCQTHGIPRNPAVYHILSHSHRNPTVIPHKTLTVQSQSARDLLKLHEPTLLIVKEEVFPVPATYGWFTLAACTLELVFMWEYVYLTILEGYTASYQASRPPA